MKLTNKCLRTMLFVPGYQDKFLEKAVSCNADALILDVEDSVPYAYRPQAREKIKKYLEKGVFKQQVYVRVNSIDSGMLLEDLKWTMHGTLDGFIPTKVETENDIVYLDKLLTQLEIEKGFTKGKFQICPLIETASAVLRSYQIAIASPRVTALTFGAEDYLTDLDGLHKEHGTSLLVPRSLIVLAARTAKIEAIDTPYLDIRNLDGFRNEVSLARELGFSGSLIIHPGQIDIANEVFSPSEQEIREAKRIIAAIEESKKNGIEVALLDNALIGPPMMKRAYNLLEKAKRIEKAKL